MRASRPWGCSPRRWGSFDPSSPAFGSVVGRPFLSSAQPSGIGRPSSGGDHEFAACDFRQRQVDHQRAPHRAGEHRRHRVGAEHRVAAAGSRHGGGRIGEAQADQHGLRHRPKMIHKHARVMAVGDAGETYSEFTRDFDGLLHCQIASRKGQALPCIRPERRRPCAAPTPAPHCRPRGRCEDAWRTGQRGPGRGRRCPGLLHGQHQRRGRARGHGLVRAGAAQRALRERLRRVESQALHQADS